MRVYTAPELPLIGRGDNTIFLGGSIEMNQAERWQDDFIQKASFLNDKWVVLNPRRKEWDETWIQKMENPHFFQQVNWEMTYLQRADHNIFYFAPNTMSPITLLELGKYGGYNSYVICSEWYLRRGNVEIFCHENQIPIYRNMNDVINELRKISQE